MISVIIPYFNNQQTLHATLSSVLASTYTHYEIIVVNDGSELSPHGVLQQFKQHNIHLIEQPNRGVSAARNTGVKHARGEYLFFLDADDLIDPSYFSLALDSYSKHSDLKVVTCNTVRFDETGEQFWPLAAPSLQQLLIQNCLIISSLIKKKDFLTINGFDESLPAYEDWDFWLRLIDHDRQIYRIDQPLFKYRIHNQLHHSLSTLYFANHEKEQALRLRVITKNAEKIFKHFGHPYKYQLAIKNFNQRPWYERLFKKVKIVVSLGP